MSRRNQSQSDRPAPPATAGKPAQKLLPFAVDYIVYDPDSPIGVAVFSNPRWRNGVFQAEQIALTSFVPGLVGGTGYTKGNRAIRIPGRYSPTTIGLIGTLGLEAHKPDTKTYQRPKRLEHTRREHDKRSWDTRAREESGGWDGSGLMLG